MKKAKIELQHLGEFSGLYKVTKLVNMATFTTPGGDIKMIGGHLNPREAESIARDKRFDVTITEAK